MGNGELVDAMIHDGLWDVYGNKHMGTYGDQCAAKCGFTKQAQDDFAVRSYTRARRAIGRGRLRRRDRAGRRSPSKKRLDHGHRRRGPGTVQRGEAAALAPGVRRRGHGHRRQRLEHQRRGGGAGGRVGRAVCQPAAQAAGTNRRRGDASAASRSGSRWPRSAHCKRLMDKVNWSVGDVDLFEINEAFAAVTMAAEQELRHPAGEGEHLRRRGGARPPDRRQRRRILVTLLNAPEADRRQARHRVPVHRRRRSGRPGRRDGRQMISWSDSCNDTMTRAAQPGRTGKGGANRVRESRAGGEIRSHRTTVCGFLVQLHRAGQRRHAQAGGRFRRQRRREDVAKAVVRDGEPQHGCLHAQPGVPPGHAGEHPRWLVKAKQQTDDLAAEIARNANIPTATDISGLFERLRSIEETISAVWSRWTSD